MISSINTKKLLLLKTFHGNLQNRTYQHKFTMQPLTFNHYNITLRPTTNYLLNIFQNSESEILSAAH